MSNSLEIKVKAELYNNVFNIVQGLNLNLSSDIIKNIAEKIAIDQANTIISSVTASGSNLVNEIPKQLIGINNPVDLVKSNLNSEDIFNNLITTVDSQVSNAVVNSIINSLRGELAVVLPAGAQLNLNLNNIVDSLNQSLTTTVTNLVSDTLNNFTSSLYSNVPNIPAIIGNIESLFDAVKIIGSFSLDDLEDVLDQIDLNYSNSITDEALDEAQKFRLDTPDNIEKLEVLDVGFQDPSATYPTADYSDQPETNKLARGEIKGTEVEKKNNDRITGIKLPFGSSFDEPESAYNGEYPYNKVTRTENGHLIEIDDTPGNERLHVYHKSGTYIEIDSNGSVVKRTRGSSYEIIDKNGKIAIRGKADISVTGACNIFVGNDANMEVIGNVNLTCHNDINATAGGKMNLTATEEINIHSANINIEADNILHVLSDGPSYFSTGETTHVTSNAEIRVFSKEDFHTISESGIKLQSSEDFNIVSEDNVKIKSTSSTDIKAGGNFNADATYVYLNSGYATDAANPEKATAAEPSNAGLLDGRKYMDVVDIHDPQPLRFSSRLTENLEGVEPTKGQLDKQQANLISSGTVTRSELDGKQDPPVAVESESPTSTQDRFIMPDQKLLTVTELPGNYKISPNFVLDNAWKTVAVCPGKHVLRAQRNLTYGQIVYNISAVALNVLEPIKKMYPKMLITSFFRHDVEYPVSPHAEGLGVDLQFPGSSRSEYYDIAVKLAKVLKYDQILLEYWVQAPYPWIHIGITRTGQFKPTGQRQIAWTFKDHKLYQQSLVNLA